MVILYFFGPDGAGKTTLIKKLAMHINKNHRTKLSWMRGSHTLASFLAKKVLAKFDTFKGSENPYYNVNIPLKLRSLWQFLEFVSALPIIIIRFVLPSSVGYWIIADRYSLDLAVWISMTTRDSSFLNRFLARILIALACKTNTKYYITADIETLRVRTQSLPFPEEQITMYNTLANVVGATTINTTKKSAIDALKEILEKLEDNE